MQYSHAYSPNLFRLLICLLILNVSIAIWHDTLIVSSAVRSAFANNTSPQNREDCSDFKPPAARALEFWDLNRKSPRNPKVLRTGRPSRTRSRLIVHAASPCLGVIWMAAGDAEGLVQRLSHNQDWTCLAQLLYQTLCSLEVQKLQVVEA